MSRLYLASDICITDYSSVFFDFANLKRPILFYAYDFDEYADEIRGMYMDMEKELPGPILRTNDAVVDALHHMDAIEERIRYAAKEEARQEANKEVMTMVGSMLAAIQAGGGACNASNK